MLQQTLEEQGGDLSQSAQQQWMTQDTSSGTQGCEEACAADQDSAADVEVDPDSPWGHGWGQEWEQGWGHGWGQEWEQGWDDGWEHGEEEEQEWEQRASGEVYVVCSVCGRAAPLEGHEDYNSWCESCSNGCSFRRSAHINSLGSQALLLHIARLEKPGEIPLGGVSLPHLRHVCEAFGKVVKVHCFPRNVDGKSARAVVCFDTDQSAFEALKELDGKALLANGCNRVFAQYSENIKRDFPKGKKILKLTIRKLKSPGVPPLGGLDLQKLREVCGLFGDVRRITCTMAAQEVIAMVEFALEEAAQAMWSIDGGTSLTDDGCNCAWVRPSKLDELVVGWDSNRHFEAVDFTPGALTIVLHITSLLDARALPLGGLALAALRAACEQFGEVVKISCRTYPATMARPAGLSGKEQSAEAFVHFSSDTGAFAAIQELNGRSISGDAYNLVQVRYSYRHREITPPTGKVLRLHVRRLICPSILPLGGLDLDTLRTACARFGQVVRISCSKRKKPIDQIDVLVEFESYEGAYACWNMDEGTSLTGDGYHYTWVSACDNPRVTVVPDSDRMRDFELVRMRASGAATLANIEASIAADDKDSVVLLGYSVHDLIDHHAKLAVQCLQACDPRQRPSNMKSLSAWLARAPKCRAQGRAFMVDPVEVLLVLLTSDIVDQSTANLAAGMIVELRGFVRRYVVALRERPAEVARVLKLGQTEKLREWSAEDLAWWACQQAFVPINVTPTGVLEKLLGDGIVQKLEATHGDTKRQLSYCLPEALFEGPQISEDEADDLDEGDVVACFDDYHLKHGLLRGVYSYGFERPSVIQQRSIKPIINGRDVIAQAQSGSGKTAAYTIGVLQRTDCSRDKCQALILAPSRELANQIQKVILALGEYLKVKCHACIGGTSVRADIDKLRDGQHVIVGMTGRVYDMISKRHFRVDDLRILVIDEADEMLDRFKDQVYDVFKCLPSKIQVCLFSATFPPAILNMTTKFMRNPFKTLLRKESCMLKTVTHFYISLECVDEKLDVLCDFYGTMSTVSTMIFLGTRRNVDFLADQMEKRDFRTSALHAELDQRERDLVMREFRSGSSRVLLTTDMLCRGIDVQSVSLVIIYDLPITRENYLHCAGRCCRFGRKGVVIILALPSDMHTLTQLQQYWGIQITECPEDIMEYM